MFLTYFWAFWYSIFMLLTYPVLGFCYIAKLVFGSKAFDFLIYKFTRFWAVLTIKSTGSIVEVKGINNLPVDNGICFIANHQSLFDIPLLMGWLDRPVGFVAKEELKKVPVINIWIVAINSVFINRDNPRLAIETINKGAEKIRQGYSMVIFPEGTRSRDNTIADFKSGSIRLATVAGATLVPLTIMGTRDIFESGKKIHASKLVLTIHKPITKDDLEKIDKKDILIKLNEIIRSSYYESV